MELNAVDLELFEAMPGINALLLPDSPHFTIVAVTEEYMQVANRTKEQLIGKRIFEAFPNTPADSSHASVNGLRKSFEQVTVEKKLHRLPLHRYDVINSAGIYEERYWSIRNKPVLNENGALAYIIHSVVELTSEILAEKTQTAHQNLQGAYQQLKESEEKYRSLFYSIDQGFCIIELLFDKDNKPIDYRFIETNPLFETQTGLAAAMGKTARELVPGLEQHWFDLYGKVALTGEPTRFTEGSEAMGRWFDVFAYRIGEAGSHKVALLFTDITQRRQTEKALVEKDRNLRNIIHAAPVAMLILNGEDMVVETINERMLQMIGKTAAMLNKPLLETLPELKGQGGYESFLTVYREGRPVYGNEIVVPLMQDGKLVDRYFNFAYSPIVENRKVVGVMDIATEVTEQVRARKLIEEKSEELQLAIDIAALGTFRIDLLHDKATYSQRIMEWFGFTEQNMSMTQIPTYVHPEDRQRVMDALRAAQKSKEESDHDVMYRVVHPKDGKLRYLRSFGKTSFNEEDQPYLTLGVIQEVTQQMMYQQTLEQNEAELQRRVLERTAELERLNDELKRSNENLEEFAYAASHDMKEPIRKIQVFTDLLKARMKNRMDGEDLRYFERVESAAKRMATLIDDLLLYSHVGRGANGMQTVDLNETLVLVREDLELARQEAGAQIVVDNLPTVYGHKRQLQQLFENLIGNALKYARKEVQSQITIEADTIKGADTPLQLTGAEGKRLYHQIKVKDNGIGFDQEDADRIFNVFTRLHGNAEYKGTGVGLSIARKVMDNHNGHIWAQSKPSEGSTFYVLFPADK